MDATKLAAIANLGTVALLIFGVIVLVIGLIDTGKKRKEGKGIVGQLLWLTVEILLIIVILFSFYQLLDYVGGKEIEITDIIETPFDFVRFVRELLGF